MCGCFFVHSINLGVNYRGQLLPTSRQASSNTSDGGGNRESSLDDSGVVDDHEEQDNELVNLPIAEVSVSRLKNSFVEHIYYLIFCCNFKLQRDVTPLTTAISPHDLQVVKCNGNITKIYKDQLCTYQPEYLSQIVILGKCLVETI